MKFKIFSISEACASMFPEHWLKTHDFLRRRGAIEKQKYCSLNILYEN